MQPKSDWDSKIQALGELLVDVSHYIALLVIGFVVIWAAGSEFIGIIQNGKAALKDILMLFIYLELLAMIGIYFKTHRLPVQFLIYIAITALSRHLVVDVQAVSDTFHLWLLITITVSIFILSLAVFLLTWTASLYGRPDDNLPSVDHAKPKSDPKTPEKLTE
ncbi:phosphate-starvation-inducible protein PsiE [Psychrobacter sp. FDAARGOS_221]|uniref:phosphate-starvation-inducible protein PsiE n=1 Tax=Psychrobacter sp. FDAARGOS_221 TaxID=1975705 RepID=UPI001D0D0C0D|nr:phosphate-starvation-inducible PsiE family protein [Psychrobacter sp. FDAARGOS_221]